MMGFIIGMTHTIVCMLVVNAALLWTAVWELTVISVHSIAMRQETFRRKLHERMCSARRILLLLM